MRKTGLAILMIFGLLLGFGGCKDASALTSSQKEMADTIADICINEWDNYGVWPSVAVRQAWVESHLGVGPNIFGCLHQAGVSVTPATYRYMRTINLKGYYGDAAFAKTPDIQFYEIMKKGRYCVGQYVGGTYWKMAYDMVSDNNWTRYDKKLRKKWEKERKKKLAKITKRKRKKRQEQPFKIIFDPELDDDLCIADPTYIKKGSEVIFGWHMYECTQTKKHLKNTIILGAKKLIDPLWDSDILDLSEKEWTLTKVIEDCKG